MNEINNLSWTDLISHTMIPSEYLEKFNVKKNIINNYKNYAPKSKIVAKIRNILLEKKLKLKVLAIGAEWCPDCAINVPRMIKIIEALDNSEVTLDVLYGVKVNALRKKGDLYWHKRHSPPEALNPKFDLQAIPTFYFFDNSGKFFGRIVEKPKKFPTLEEEIFNILKSKA